METTMMIELTAEKKSELKELADSLTAEQIEQINFCTNWSDEDYNLCANAMRDMNAELAEKNLYPVCYFGKRSVSVRLDKGVYDSDKSQLDRAHEFGFKMGGECHTFNGIAFDKKIAAMVATCNAMNLPVPAFVDNHLAYVLGWIENNGAEIGIDVEAILSFHD